MMDHRMLVAGGPNGVASLVPWLYVVAPKAPSVKVVQGHRVDTAARAWVSSLLGDAKVLLASHTRPLPSLAHAGMSPAIPAPGWVCLSKLKTKA